MTSKEIVKRTLDFTRPERMARSLPEPWGSDFRGAGADYAGLGTGWEQVSESRWEHTDEWGNTWARIDEHSKGEVSKGALENIGDVEELAMPPLAHPARYEAAAKSVKDNKEYFISGGLPGFTFNVARKIRRLDQYMMDLHLHRDKIEILHDRVDEVLLAMIDNYGRIGCDGICTGEDWGTQLGLMIHPRLWREIFKPRFERICGAAKKHGMKLLLHSCGKINDIIPDLIEVGVDALLFDQQVAQGLDFLASFAGKVTYQCPVDIQKVLQTGDEATIRAWARELVDKLWCGGKGGFIADYYRGIEAIGVQPEWQAWACDEFVKAGVQRGGSRH
ncbi:MAG: uroporphyrinogen decarboxylase family protein [Planctomycetota bacterium]